MKSEDPGTRSYRKRKRAEAEEETRLRITEAAVELHGTVGPAHTTRTGVAKRAGVSRATVYNHFPTDVDLFVACSTHWARQNPFPDPSAWSDEHPAERLRAGLSELYDWYGRKREMLGKVLRDTPTVPALAEVMSGLWDGYMDRIVEVLADGWPDGGGGEGELHAVLRLAIDFNTWAVLSASGLDDDGAAQLMARMAAAYLLDEVESAGAPTSARRGPRRP